MTRHVQSPQSVILPRREFFKCTGAVAGVAMAGAALAPAVHAAGSDTLKIGLVGCGGRGSGAAMNALNADPNCKIVAMADAFEDRLSGSLNALKKEGGDRVAVEKDRCYLGFDAAEKLIASDVDVVILTEPPHFRPQHLKLCIDAGKHVFCEKPVAVDAPGVRSVLASAAEAKKKNLNIVSGLCWRYHYGVRETMKRVLDGAIGNIVSITETYNTGALWLRARQPDWTEMTYQLRNWLYFTWLSGDFNNEQHIHSLDKAMWAMHDEPPVSAWGLGGRQVRTDNAYGNIFDHHAVCYEFPGGVPVHAYCRQMPNCYNDTNDVIYGTKGRASVLKFQIDGEKQWRYDGPDCNMYDVEHKELFAAIRAGTPINNGVYMARSTMLAILGRMATYTGAAIKWDDAINSQETLAPSAYGWDAAPPIVPDAQGKYPVAVPGVTKFV